MVLFFVLLVVQFPANAGRRRKKSDDGGLEVSTWRLYRRLGGMSTRRINGDQNAVEYKAARIAQGFKSVPIPGSFEWDEDYEKNVEVETVEDLLGTKVGLVNTHGRMGRSLQGLASFFIPGDMGKYRSPVRSAIYGSLTPGGGGLPGGGVGGGGVGGRPSIGGRAMRCPQGYLNGGRFTDQELSNCGSVVYDTPAKGPGSVTAADRGKITRRFQGSKPEDLEDVARDLIVKKPKGDPFAVVREAAMKPHARPNTKRRESSVSDVVGFTSKNRNTTRIVRRDGVVYEPRVGANQLVRMKDHDNLKDAVYVTSKIGKKGIAGDELRLLTKGAKAVQYVFPEGSVRVNRKGSIGENTAAKIRTRWAALSRDPDVIVNPIAAVEKLVREFPENLAIQPKFKNIKNADERVVVYSPTGERRIVPRWVFSLYLSERAPRRPSGRKPFSVVPLKNEEKVVPNQRPDRGEYAALLVEYMPLAFRESPLRKKNVSDIRISDTFGLSKDSLIDVKAAQFVIAADSEEMAVKVFRRALTPGGRNRGGRIGSLARRAPKIVPYNPDARDGDNDGLRQEGTIWERPAGTVFQNVARGARRMSRGMNIVDGNGKRVDYKPGDGERSPLRRIDGRRAGGRVDRAVGAGRLRQRDVDEDARADFGPVDRRNALRRARLQRAIGRVQASPDRRERRAERLERRADRDEERGRADLDRAEVLRQFRIERDALDARHREEREELDARNPRRERRQERRGQMLERIDEAVGQGRQERRDRDEDARADFGDTRRRRRREGRLDRLDERFGRGRQERRDRDERARADFGDTRRRDRRAARRQRADERLERLDQRVGQGRQERRDREEGARAKFGDTRRREERRERHVEVAEKKKERFAEKGRGNIRQQEKNKIEADREKPLAAVVADEVEASLGGNPDGVEQMSDVMVREFPNRPERMAVEEMRAEMGEIDAAHPDILERPFLPGRRHDELEGELKRRGEIDRQLPPLPEDAPPRGDRLSVGEIVDIGKENRFGDPRHIAAAEDLLAREEWDADMLAEADILTGYMLPPDTNDDLYSRLRGRVFREQQGRPDSDVINVVVPARRPTPVPRVNDPDADSAAVMRHRPDIRARRAHDRVLADMRGGEDQWAKVVRDFRETIVFDPDDPLAAPGDEDAVFTSLIDAVFPYDRREREAGVPTIAGVDELEAIDIWGADAGNTLRIARSGEARDPRNRFEALSAVLDRVDDGEVENPEILAARLELIHESLRSAQQQLRRERIGEFRQVRRDHLLANPDDPDALDMAVEAALLDVLHRRADNQIDGDIGLIDMILGKMGREQRENVIDNPPDVPEPDLSPEALELREALVQERFEVRALRPRLGFVEAEYRRRGDAPNLDMAARGIDDAFGERVASGAVTEADRNRIRELARDAWSLGPDRSFLGRDGNTEFRIVSKDGGLPALRVETSGGVISVKMKKGNEVRTGAHIEYRKRDADGNWGGWLYDNGGYTSRDVHFRYTDGEWVINQSNNYMYVDPNGRGIKNAGFAGFYNNNAYMHWHAVGGKFNVGVSAAGDGQVMWGRQGFESEHATSRMVRSLVPELAAFRNDGPSPDNIIIDELMAEEITELVRRHEAGEPVSLMMAHAIFDRDGSHPWNKIKGDGSGGVSDKNKGISENKYGSWWLQNAPLSSGNLNNDGEFGDELTRLIRRVAGDRTEDGGPDITPDDLPEPSDVAPAGGQIIRGANVGNLAPLRGGLNRREGGFRKSVVDADARGHRGIVAVGANADIPDVNAGVAHLQNGGDLAEVPAEMMEGVLYGTSSIDAEDASSMFFRLEGGSGITQPVLFFRRGEDGRVPRVNGSMVADGYMLKRPDTDLEGHYRANPERSGLRRFGVTEQRSQVNEAFGIQLADQLGFANGGIAADGDFNNGQDRMMVLELANGVADVPGVRPLGEFQDDANLAIVDSLRTPEMTDQRLESVVLSYALGSIDQHQDNIMVLTDENGMATGILPIDFGRIAMSEGMDGSQPEWAPRDFLQFLATTHAEQNSANRQDMGAFNLDLLGDIRNQVTDGTRDRDSTRAVIADVLNRTIEILDQDEGDLVGSIANDLYGTGFDRPAIVAQGDALGAYVRQRAEHLLGELDALADALATV